MGVFLEMEQEGWLGSLKVTIIEYFEQFPDAYLYLLTPGSWLLTPDSFVLTPGSLLLTPGSLLLTPAGAACLHVWCPCG